MPARTVKRRRERPEEGPLDEIPPDVMAAICSSGSEDTNETPRPPAPPPVDPTDGSIPGSPARQLLEAQAGRLDERAWGLALYGALGPLFGPGVETFAYKLFLDHYLAEINPSGPIERMLSEQLFMSHHLVGHLSVKAMNCGNADAAKVYLGAAARLLAEFRQSAVVLKGFRTTPVPPPASGLTKPPEPVSPKGQNRDRVVDSDDSPLWASELRSNNRLKGLFRDEPAEQNV